MENVFILYTRSSLQLGWVPCEIGCPHWHKLQTCASLEIILSSGKDSIGCKEVHCLPKRPHYLPIRSHYLRKRSLYLSRRPSYLPKRARYLLMRPPYLQNTSPCFPMRPVWLPTCSVYLPSRSLKVIIFIAFSVNSLLIPVLVQVCNLDEPSITGTSYADGIPLGQTYASKGSAGWQMPAAQLGSVVIYLCFRSKAETRKARDDLVPSVLFILLSKKDYPHTKRNCG